MAAWYVPSQNGSVIILLHGYGTTRTAMTWHAERLYEAGYGLLMYDERASGESEGEQRSYGWQDAVDVGGAIRYLQSKPELNQGQIGIVGCSVGGQIALQGAAYYPQIQAVWADGAATIRAKDMLPKTHPILLLARPSSYLIDWMMAQKLEMTLPSAIIEIIGTIDKPIMLVAGGTPLPLYGAESEIQARFASFAAENTEVWVIDEAVHCDGPQHRPEEYGARLVAFFDDALDLGE
jgi:pimeloyl-ACP methyl ester carboxylesterase